MRVGAEQRVLQRLLAVAPARRPVEDGGRGEVAAQAAWPEHVDAAIVERADAVVEQADQLVGVEGDLVGHPQLEQPVEHRPRLGRARSAMRRVGAGPVAEAVAGARARLGPEQCRVADVEGVALVLHLEHHPDRAGDQLLLVGLDPQRDRTSCGRSSRRRGAGPVRAWSRSAVAAATSAGPGPARAGRARAPGAAGALRGIASATASSTWRTTSAALVLVEPSSRRDAGQQPRPGRVGGVERGDPPAGAPSAGSNLPAATRRIPSSAAPESRPTLGWRSSRAWARVSTGRAARIGSATVRRSSVNSHDTLARRVARAKHGRPGDGDEAHAEASGRGTRRRWVWTLGRPTLAHGTDTACPRPLAPRLGA